MDIVRPIHNDADHTAALREIERLWGAAPGSPEGDTLDVLATLVERYEEERFPMPAADPVEVIVQHMEERGLSRKDFAAVLGSQSRATEILSHKRPLTIPQIRRIRDNWRIPADLLIGPERGKPA
jgi:HTH-type transcriptional regulator/antitoxin HigA